MSRQPEKEIANEMEVDEAINLVPGGGSETLHMDTIVEGNSSTAAAAGGSAGGAATGALPSSPSNNAFRVMASSGTVGSVSISLHPLVIMNVSEHWTRLRAQEGSDQLGLHFFSLLLVALNDTIQTFDFRLTVYGALIGKQKGRNIEIMNSFELRFTCSGDRVFIDRDYYNAKEEQFKQVFSEMDFLGWYTTGETPNESDIRVHKQLCEINECPVLLKLDPRPKNTDVR